MRFDTGFIQTTDRELMKRAKDFDGESWLKVARFTTNQTQNIFNVASNPIAAEDRIKPNLRFQAPESKGPIVELFRCEQEFEGVVISVEPDSKFFWARLIDTNKVNPDEEAEFQFSEISSDDWGLIMPGALFSWNIGLASLRGQVRRVSEIRFRRNFKFSQEKIAQSEKAADELFKLIQEISHISNPAT